MQSRAISQTMELSEEAAHLTTVMLNLSWHVVVTGKPGVTLQHTPPSTHTHTLFAALTQVSAIWGFVALNKMRHFAQSLTEYMSVSLN